MQQGVEHVHAHGAAVDGLHRPQACASRAEHQHQHRDLQHPHQQPFGGAVALLQQVAGAGPEGQRLDHLHEQPLLGSVEGVVEPVHGARVQPPCGGDPRRVVRVLAQGAEAEAALLQATMSGSSTAGAQGRGATRCPGAPPGCRRGGCPAAPCRAAPGWGSPRSAARRRESPRVPSQRACNRRTRQPPAARANACRPARGTAAAASSASSRPVGHPPGAAPRNTARARPREVAALVRPGALGADAERAAPAGVAPAADRRASSRGRWCGRQTRAPRPRGRATRAPRICPGCRRPPAWVRWRRRRSRARGGARSRRSARPRPCGRCRRSGRPACRRRIQHDSGLQPLRSRRRQLSEQEHHDGAAWQASAHRRGA